MEHMDRFSDDDHEWIMGVGRDYEMDSLDVRFVLSPADHHTVNLMSVEAAEPRSGEGTQFMRFITEMADRHGVTLRLEAEPYGDDQMPADRLAAWYARFGFTELGEPPQFSKGCVMIRQPR